MRSSLARSRKIGSLNLITFLLRFVPRNKQHLKLNPNKNKGAKANADHKFLKSEIVSANSEKIIRKKTQHLFVFVGFQREFPNLKFAKPT